MVNLNAPVYYQLVVGVSVGSFRALDHRPTGGEFITVVVGTYSSRIPRRRNVNTDALRVSVVVVVISFWANTNVPSSPLPYFRNIL